MAFFLRNIGVSRYESWPTFAVIIINQANCNSDVTRMSASSPAGDGQGTASAGARHLYDRSASPTATLNTCSRSASCINPCHPTMCPFRTPLLSTRCASILVRAQTLWAAAAPTWKRTSHQSTIVSASSAPVVPTGGPTNPALGLYKVLRLNFGSETATFADALLDAAGLAVMASSELL